MRIVNALTSGQRKGQKSRRNNRTEGSVSIFLIMVLAFVFLFTAVLIDYARISAANVQQERLARAAVRSVMSSYDNSLRENYGLFAFGGDDGDQLLSGVLNDNLYESGRGDAFNLLPVKLDNSSLIWSRSIGSYDIFRRQIAEEMKYKAPIDFTLELAGKFKPLSAAMGEASRSTKVLGKLQPLYDAREAALDLMMKRRRQAAESGRVLQQMIMNPAKDDISTLSLGNIASAADIVAMYGDYVGKYYADLFRDRETQSEKYQQALARYIEQAAALISGLPGTLSAYKLQHNSMMAEAKEALKQAGELNEQMRSVLEQSRTSGAESGEASASGWDIPGSSNTELSADPLAKLREQEDALILTPAEISGMEQDLIAQELASEAVEPPVSALPAVLSGVSGLYADFAQMSTAVIEASRASSNYLKNYGDDGAVITAEAARIEMHRTSDSERKQLERQAKTKLGDAMKLLEQIRSLGDSAGAAMERYSTLRQYYEDNIKLNQAQDHGTTGDAGNGTDIYSSGGSAMEKVDGLYASIGSIMEGARDRLFQTEYSALYFPHFDLSLLTPAVSGPAGDTASVLADQLDPHAQELEYILYGFHNPAGNVAAAFGEIFALRLAIRTMEGFIESARLSNPLAILAAALLYGVEQAVQDMLLLCKTGEVPLSKYLPAKLKYRDYLRLFMLLHGTGDVQLSRMLALIRLDTGINPAERFTYASAGIRMGLRLWFLPGVVKLLDYSSALPGEVEGKVYYRAVQADYSY
ncbi:hypothetical protein [Paenibacillus tianjinensis]|uniref:Flp pilus-assembly TadE/G-like n=1 Tax=Paenibacillus tianjinensis TaxID=2810347 RepID=A0ABX7LCZ4_9BACL|nr:hypothetical protein [Paenibacillus tianjinensis]QSF45995.1 hypothetical protein JRJ22_05050 [Paenibacillus tianjinensis]